jgi:hypothetical protein
MKLTKELAELITGLEYELGCKCNNPNSYNGYTQVYGKSYRYPVTFSCSKEENKLSKTRSIVRGLEGPELIRTMRYKFGSNEMWVGRALETMLNILEERYDIDFNELEERRIALMSDEAENEI